MRAFLTGVGVTLALVAGTSQAHAQVTSSISPVTAPVLGNAVRGTNTTVFSVSTTGVVAKVSGTGFRVASSGVTVPTVNISCGTGCNGSQRRIRVTIVAAPVTNGVGIVLFRVGALTNGQAYRNGTPAEAASLDFEINSIGNNGSTSFPLGMNISMSNAAATGVQTRGYTVTVTLL